MEKALKKKLYILFVLLILAGVAWTIHNQGFLSERNKFICLVNNYSQPGKSVTYSIKFCDGLNCNKFKTKKILSGKSEIIQATVVTTSSGRYGGGGLYSEHAKIQSTSHGLSLTLLWFEKPVNEKSCHENNTYYFLLKKSLTGEGDIIDLSKITK